MASAPYTEGLHDTLFDRRLTERMLAAMRRATPAAQRIDTLVNTHANGDHCYGNELVGDARIIASERTAAEMRELPPSAFAMLLEQAPNMGEVGEFFQRCFGSFEFAGIEPKLPGETFSTELVLRVGAREVKAYFEYLYEQARDRHAQGMTPVQAARSIALDRWAPWGEGERLAVNLATIFRELDGEPEPANAMLAFQQMAELARDGG